jgi:hypothetical protein
VKGGFKLYYVALRNIILCLNLRKIGLIIHPKRLVWITQTELFNFRTLTGRRKLVQKNVSDIIEPAGPATSIQFALPNKWMGEDASYTKDMVSLALACQLAHPTVIFEIGTLDGYTAGLFALNSGDDARIYTLDLPKDQVPALAVTDMDRAHIVLRNSTRDLDSLGRHWDNKIIKLFGDSFSFDFSPYHGQVELFFIDGAHSYQYVKSDTENALKCIKKGGLLIWHDYGREGVNGVTRYLHEVAHHLDIYSVPGSSIAFSVIK